MGSNTEIAKLSVENTGEKKVKELISIMNISRISSIGGGVLIILAILGMGLHVRNFDNRINELNDNISEIDKQIEFRLVNIQQSSFSRVIATGAADTNRILKSLNGTNVSDEKVRDYMKLSIITLDPSKVNDENLDNLTIRELNTLFSQTSKKFENEFNKMIDEKAALASTKNTLENTREKWFKSYLFVNSIGLLLSVLGQSLKK